MAVYVAGWASGGHLNPAVTVSMAVLDKLSWTQVPSYLAGQFFGGFIGAILVWAAYLPHWSQTEDPVTKLGVFATVPAIRHSAGNLICEVIGTAVLLVGALGIASTHNKLTGGLNPFLVGILVFSIGLW